MSSPNEHLARAESLIEQLEARWAETSTPGTPKWAQQDIAALAELHLAAANARANIRAALTLQNIAALMAGDPDTPTPETPEASPWAPPTNVHPLPPRTNKPTE